MMHVPESVILVTDMLDGPEIGYDIEFRHRFGTEKDRLRQVVDLCAVNAVPVDGCVDNPERFEIVFGNSILDTINVKVLVSQLAHGKAV
jgi:hypothetical protein